MKKRLCLLLALVMLLAVLPLPVGAAPTVYFSAVNDTLLELSDDTMPLWSGSRLYVTYTGAWKSDLGISYSYNKNTKKAIFYHHQNVLVCDLEKNTVTDNDGGSYAGAPLERGGMVFVPIAALTEFFSLSYSYTKIDNGYLVRIKNGDVVLTDERFIEAATAPMLQRYERYVKAQEPVVETPPEVTPPPTTERRSTAACLALQLTDAEAAERVLDALGTIEQLSLLYAGGEGFDNVLRRAAGSGCALILVVDGSQGAEHALAEIAARNDALWAAASVKTRFVHLKGGDEETRAALEEEGWCCVSFAADVTGTTDSARMASRILTAAERRNRALVLLGADSKMQGRMSTVLRALREGNCRSVKLRETYL